MRLNQKTAIITGAATGIGRATALRFAAEGANVLVADVNASGLDAVCREIHDRGGRAANVCGDISRADTATGLVDAALRAFGALHILVNNAAAYRDDGAAMRIHEDVWDRILAVNLKGPWLCARAAVPAMESAGGGSIINIASVNALLGLSLTAYSSSKGGLLALTRVLAMELGSRRIRVNAISPGTILTEESQRIYDRQPGLQEQVTQMYPMRELGTPDDIANCAVYLASDESRFVTGSNFIIDGGFTAGRPFDIDFTKES